MKIKVCPRCGSENVEWIIPQNWSQWTCYDCDFTGPVIEISREGQKELQEHWKKHKKEILSKAKKDHEREDKEDDMSDEELDEKLDKLIN